MKILVHDYGGYAFTVQLGRALAHCGHEVRYIYSESTQTVKRGEFRRFPDDPETFIITGIHLSKPFQKNSFIKRRSQETEHGRRVGDEIKRFIPELVISADAPLDAQVEIVKSCQQVKARFVFWLQDLISIATLKILEKKWPVVGRLVGKYYINLEKKLLIQSNAIVTISDDFTPILKEWKILSDKIYFIPNWAPVDEIPCGYKKNPWSVEHQVDQEFCFIYTGILGLKHNPELLLYLAETMKDNPNVKIIVVSEGLGADWLREKQKQMKLENLVVYNFQPKDCYPDILATADVLVSILGEDANVFSVPSKILSYLCAQRAILLAGPKNNLSTRIVEHNGAGIAVSPDNAEGFIQAAKLLMQDGKLRQSCARNARKYAEEHFDIEQITRQFESIL